MKSCLSLLSAKSLPFFIRRLLYQGGRRSLLEPYQYDCNQSHVVVDNALEQFLMLYFPVMLYHWHAGKLWN